jgi:hypothetical protein
MYSSQYTQNIGITIDTPNKHTYRLADSNSGSVSRVGLVYSLTSIYNALLMYISPCIIHLALEHARARGSVCLLSAVQVVCDTRVGSLVRAREGDGGRGLARAAGDDVDLRTLHVELRTGVAASRVQSNELTTEQVLTGCNAGWDGDGLLALVGDQAVDTPLGAVERVLSNLVLSVRSAKGRLLSMCLTLNHPLPTPESVFASETFFR